jgi:D-proline reductase (dithiol) PrdB
VGLIQRAIERVGIATIGISLVREFTEKVKPPRTIFLRWPFGHPLGEPYNRAQQWAVLAEAFKALYAIRTPGEIVDLPFRWRREKYNLESISMAEIGKPSFRRSL